MAGFAAHLTLTSLADAVMIEGPVAHMTADHLRSSVCRKRNRGGGRGVEGTCRPR